MRSSRCRSPGPIEPPPSRRGRARRSGGPAIARMPTTVPASTVAASASVSARPVRTSASSRLLTNRPTGVCSRTSAATAAAGARPHHVRSAARGAPPRGEPGRCRDQYQDDHRHTNQFARGAIWETLHDRGCPTTDCACGRARRHPGARRSAGDRRSRLEPRRVSSRIGRAHGRAPRAGLPGGHRHRVRAAGGGDAPGRLGAPDVCASRARLRPPRRARERVAGGAPDEPSHRHLLLALGDRRRLCRSRCSWRLTTLVAVVLRKWRVAAFILTAIAVEAATYRVATLAIDRQRPHVRRLDDLPVSDSFYSGHTAASVAVYCGIALLITSSGAKPRGASRSCGSSRSRSRCSSRWPGCTAGMHHPTDVTAGLLVGIGMPDRRPDRRPRRGSGCTGERAREPDRGHRARRQEHRGRPSRASPHARPPRRHATRSGPRCRRAARRRSRSGACSSREPTTSSCGAATGWRSAASTRSPGRARRWRSSPPGRRICSHPTWAFRRTSRERSSPGSRDASGRSTSRA